MDRERIGKYRIVGKLGQGTMGEVYQAEDPVLKRFVALKTLAVRAAPGDETLQRFQREAQAAALLNHPNIVTVHDFGEEEDGLLYMAMELLVGTDLRDAIDGDLLKTLDEKLDVMDGILAALDYAHAKGVVHRDVKPANIHLVGPWGSSGGGAERQVKIMDFGLARVSTSEMTQEGIVLGTPNYMSPEQALGDKVDGRSDLFSSGAVLYELLTGHKPFEADSTPSVLFQVVHRQPPPVRRWAPDVPTGIVAVVNRALDKDRDKRFASAGDMRAALAVARQAVAAAAAPKAPPLPPARPARPAPPPLPPGAAAATASGPFATNAPPVPPRPRVPTPAAHSVAAGAPLEARPRWRPGTAMPVRRSLLPPLVVGGGLALLALAASRRRLWLRGRPVPAAAPSPGAASAEVSALTGELVRKQVRLARRELEDKNYAAAAAEAEGALKLAPGHAEAAARARRGARARRARSTERSPKPAGSSPPPTPRAPRASSRACWSSTRATRRRPSSPARLNSVFRAQADEAAVSMRAARAAALAAGTGGDALRPADRGREGRGGAPRARRVRRRDPHVPRGPRRLRPRAPGRAPAAGGAPAAAGTPPPRPGAAATAPRRRPRRGPPCHGGRRRATRRRRADGDAHAGAQVHGGGDVRGHRLERAASQGFDSSDVSSRRPPQFAGRMEFEVLPPAVRPGEPFVVRIHLAQRRAALGEGARASPSPRSWTAGAPPLAVKPLQREVPAQARALVAEYSGVWGEAASWALEAVVTADRNETVTSRLRAN